MSVMSGTDAGKLSQSSSIVCGLLTQGVALGWNLQTPSALVSELYSSSSKGRGQRDFEEVRCALFIRVAALAAAQTQAESPALPGTARLSDVCRSVPTR